MLLLLNLSCKYNLNEIIKYIIIRLDISLTKVLSEV